MADHELARFLTQDLQEMQSEYERIYARSVEDPGTACDEGEEAWAAVLRDWLPADYQIRVKGRILDATGAAGPQVDIVVLRPGYPKRLLDKKLYLSGGVAAAFECKNTLKVSHLDKAWKTANAIEKLDGRDRERSPFHALTPSIYYGLLAHGHSWTNPKSDPLNVIVGKIRELLQSTTKISEAPSLICVANLASWDTLRIAYDGPGLMPSEVWEARRRLRGLINDEPSCAIQYSIATLMPDEQVPSNPLGALVANLVGRLAFEDVTLRPLSQYFFASGMGGTQGVPVAARDFPLGSQYPAAIIEALPNALTNGVNGSEWALAFNF